MFELRYACGRVAFTVLTCLLVASSFGLAQPKPTTKEMTLKVDLDEKKLYPGGFFPEIMVVTAETEDGKNVPDFTVVVTEVFGNVKIYSDRNQGEISGPVTTTNGNVFLSLDTRGIPESVPQERFTLVLQGSAKDLVAKKQGFQFLVTNKQVVQSATGTGSLGTTAAKGKIVFSPAPDFYPGETHDLAALVWDAAGNAMANEKMVLEISGDATFGDGNGSATASTDSTGKLALKIKTKANDEISDKRTFKIEIHPQKNWQMLKGEFTGQVKKFALQFHVDRQWVDLVENLEYVDALVVTVNNKDGNPKPGVSVTATVTEGQIGLAGNGSPDRPEYYKSSSAQTDRQGVASFSMKTAILTGLKADTTSAEYKISFTSGEQDPMAPPVTISGKISKLPGPHDESRRLFGEIFVGNSFGRKFDDSGQAQGFSDSNPLFILRTESLWGRDAKWRLRVGVDIELSGVLTQSQTPANPDPMTPMTDPDGMPKSLLTTTTTGDMTQSVTLKTVEAFNGSLHFLWEPPWKGFQSYSATSNDAKLPYDALRLGLTGSAGFTNRNHKKASDGDTEIGSWELGLSLRHYKTASPRASTDFYNQAPTKFIRAVYSRFEEWPQGIVDLPDDMRPANFQKFRDRAVFDAGLRLIHLDKGKEIPVFAGIHANVGRGPDDLRLFIGTLFKFRDLKKILN